MYVYVLNLQRCSDRKKKSLQSLLAFGVPEDKIKFWVAKDNLYFEKNSDLMRAAAADGFPIFQQWLDNGDHLHANIGILAQTWSYFDFYRYALENLQDPFVFVHDDWFFIRPYTELAPLVAEAERLSGGNWRYISLQNPARGEPIEPNRLLINATNSAGADDSGGILNRRSIEWIHTLYEAHGSYTYLEDLIRDTDAIDCVYSVNESFIACNETPSLIHNTDNPEHRFRMDVLQ